MDTRVGVVISMPIQSTAIIYYMIFFKSALPRVMYVCYNLLDETTLDWTLALTPLSQVQLQTQGKKKKGKEEKVTEEKATKAI